MTTPSSPGAHPRLVVGMGAVVFVALVILGAGIVSFATDANPIAVTGIGALPGVFAIIVATLAWGGVLLSVARGRPGLGAALLAGVVAALAQIVVLILATLGGGIATALTIAAHHVTSGFALVTFLAAVLAATGVVVALRADGGTPRWRWEKNSEDE